MASSRLSSRFVAVLLLASPVVHAQDGAAPAQPAPAPAADAPVVEPTPAASPAPAAAPAEAATPAVPPAPSPGTYEAECWRVATPGAEPVAMMPDADSEAQLLQVGFGPITRRAAYNTLGMDDRLAGTQARQETLLRDLRFKKIAAPLAIGALALTGGLLLGIMSIGAVVLWVVAGGMKLPIINNDNRTNQTLSYVVWLTAVAGLPVAIVSMGGGLIPLVLSGFKAVQLRKVPESPLLDQTGFTVNEANELAAAQNARLAKRMGLAETPACKGN